MRAACGRAPHTAVLLLAAAAALLARPSGGEVALGEEDIMGRLRQLAHDAGIIRPDMHWTGWDLGDRAHHCLWHRVECDTRKRVTKM